MNNTLVLVTFDENSSYAKQNKVFTFLVGDAVARLVGTTDDSYYNHYSEISTVQANWGLHTLGRWDVGANVFRVVADATGDEVRPWQGAVPLCAALLQHELRRRLQQQPSRRALPQAEPVHQARRPQRIAARRQDVARHPESRLLLGQARDPRRPAAACRSTSRSRLGDSKKRWTSGWPCAG